MIFRRDPVDADTALWLANAAARLIAALDAKYYFNDTDLILPTRAFFNAGKGQDHETALAVYDDVLRLMGIEDCPAILVRGSGHIEGAAVDHNRLQATGGTYQHEPDQPVITYNPDVLAQPVTFISILAHELSHLLMFATMPDDILADPAAELLTDLTAILCGFGVIQMMGARQAGWQGYLSNDSRAFATALFVRTKQINPTDALSHLDSYVRKRLDRSLDMLDRQPGYLDPILALRA